MLLKQIQLYVKAKNIFLCIVLIKILNQFQRIVLSRVSIHTIIQNSQVQARAE